MWDARAPECAFSIEMQTKHAANLNSNPRLSSGASKLKNEKSYGGTVECRGLTFFVELFIGLNPKWKSYGGTVARRGLTGFVELFIGFSPKWKSYGGTVEYTNLTPFL